MADKQGKHLRELPLCILILLVIVGDSVGQRSARNKKDCSKTEYRHDGVCCDKCAVGHKLIKKCSSGMTSTCEICTEGTYQDKMNYFPNCFRCQKCNKRKHAVVISPCTYQNNTVCGCQNGYHMRFYDSFSWDCVPHKNRASRFL
ncbi:tumor necrosis factor receptor superfamily member 1A-like [Myxocyprinus asiaticus]|uniref:tumor necrosis factor receptor superfamily member 1A-like n=1 Tax=Myxocyprinus asiaticus TaxID=70543 RepID=UPI00222164B1|nr:tumor necrosis factor receptor superfamily member 1A-like [Myxocyprinus asiaticus]